MKVLDYRYGREVSVLHRWRCFGWGYARNPSFFHAHLELWRVRLYVSWRR